MFEIAIREFASYLGVHYPLNSVAITTKATDRKCDKIYIYQFPVYSVIVSPCDVKGNIIQIAKNQKRVSAEQLACILNKEWNCTYYENLYLNPHNFTFPISPQGYSVHLLNKRHENALFVLQNACTKKEVEYGSISLNDPVVYGAWAENQLISVASYWFWGEKLADIGVLTHPAHRCCGVSKAVVANLCKHGIKMEKINIYRYRIENKASKFLALSLGFEKFMSAEVLDKTTSTC